MKKVYINSILLFQIYRSIYTGQRRDLQNHNRKDKINVLKIWNTGQVDFRQRKKIRIVRIHEMCREI